MTALRVEKQREYDRRYRHNSRDKARAKAKRYKEANRLKITEQQKHYHRRYYENVTGRAVAVLGVTRIRAKRKGLEFTLTKQWMDTKMLIGCCEVSGIPFDLSRNGLRLKTKAPFAPSVDRKDNSKGYTPDNSRLVCAVVNFAMNEWGLEPVMKLARALAAK